MLVYQTNIELYVDGELICRPNNFGEGVLLTLGAYYMSDFESDKASPHKMLKSKNRNMQCNQTGPLFKNAPQFFFSHNDVTRELPLF